MNDTAHLALFTAAYDADMRRRHAHAALVHRPLRRTARRPLLLVRRQAALAAG